MTESSMWAAQLASYRAPLELNRVPIPKPGRGEVLLRVLACGVCRSDWHLWSGDWNWRMQPHLPHTPGHELAGVVVECGPDVTSLVEGMQVTVPFHLSCGSCSWCTRGFSNRCLRYTSLGFQVPGGLAEYICIPNAAENVFPLPAGIDAESAAALGCRYSSAYHALTDQAALGAGETLAVFGAGGLGLASVQVGIALGARVLAVDPSSRARAMAESFGAIAVWHEDADDRLAAIRALAPDGADVSMDALGSAATAVPALRSLRPGGRHVQAGLTGMQEKGMLPLPVDELVKREITLIGSVGCPRQRFREVLERTAKGDLNPAPLVTRRVPLAEASDVFHAMTDFRTTGVILVLPGA